MAEAKRRLAAILSADVAGYSRLMGADEEGTVAPGLTLARYRYNFRFKNPKDNERFLEGLQKGGLPEQ